MPIHKGENPYIYGLHDRGGEHLMMVNGEAKGWVLVTEAIGSEANERGGGDYRAIIDKKLGLIVRLNQSYGENGTIPREARYPEFAQRVANFVEDSQGANIWLIGNEMNFAREQPRQSGSNEPEPITPRRYAECYKMCRRKIKSVPGHENDLVVVGSIGPWNVETKYEADPRGAYQANSTGDWIIYMRDILLAIGPNNCDAIAIHAYSHGYAPDMVFSKATMNPPFQNRYYNFFTYRDQMNAIPDNMKHLPVYLTEANGDREDGSDPTWPHGNNGWIKNAYKEIDQWNRSGKQQIRCMILFRWKKDPLGWSIDGKPEVQQDFREAIAKNYRWNPEVGQPEQDETVMTAAAPGAASQPPAVEIPRPAIPGYRTRYLQHNMPSSVRADQTLNITLTVQNTGSFAWVQGGPNPFRLGFQWYDTNGQLVKMASEVDFRTPLPHNVQPNQQVSLQARLRTPNIPGTYQLRWDMVHEMVTWFVTQGDAGLLVSPVTVAPAVAVAPTPTPVARPAQPQPAPAPSPTQPQPAPTPAPVAEPSEPAPADRPVQPQPAPTPSPTPAPVAQRARPVAAPTPTPVPSPAPAAVTATAPAQDQIQNISQQLAQHPSRRYARRSLDAIRRVIIHHTATPAHITVQRIAQFQVSQKELPGITYHLCITAEGAAYQTQPLILTAAHAGQNSRDSVGVCLIGNFTNASPPQSQLNATVFVLARLAKTLNLTTDQIFGYSEIVRTQSPGATWPQWKEPLLARVRSLINAAPPATPPAAPAGKLIEHYMLLWHHGSGNWAEWDLRGALDYIGKFPVTIGFSVQEARLAKNVTIVGGPGGIPDTVDQMLRSAGCKVERLAGATEDETRQILEGLARQGKRFRNLS